MDFSEIKADQGLGTIIDKRVYVDMGLCRHARGVDKVPKATLSLCFEIPVTPHLYRIIIEN